MSKMSSLSSALSVDCERLQSEEEDSDRWKGDEVGVCLVGDYSSYLVGSYVSLASEGIGK